MNQDIQTILLSEERLKEIVADLGRRISEDYKDKNLLMVSVDVYKRQVTAFVFRVTGMAFYPLYG